ncbi:MAG TPA: TolC family protein, partial [Flavobacteriaceae bacterium]|nr:TolC family protein [Flavobacteriaceae bacterium]
MKTFNSIHNPMNIRQSIKLFFAAAIMLVGFSSYSQEKLTLQQAISYALENKAEAKKAKLATQNAENQIAEVRSQALPQISLSGNLVYNPILQESALPGEFFGQPGTMILVPFGQEWMALGGVSVFQNVFNYSVFTGLKAARSTREFYQVNQQLTEEQVIEAVANSYYQALIVKQKLQTIETTLENTLAVQKTVQGLFDSGLARKIDLDRIKVNAVNLTSAKQQIENQVVMQENMLKFLMGMPIDEPILIEEEALEITPVLMEAPDVKQLSAYQLLDKQRELLTYNK